MHYLAYTVIALRCEWGELYALIVGENGKLGWVPTSVL